MRRGRSRPAGVPGTAKGVTMSQALSNGRFRALLVAAGVAVLAACPREGAVWIEPGSTASTLTFGVGIGRNGRPHEDFQGLRVDACSSVGGPPGSAYWLLTPVSVVSEVGRVRYGVPPEGYQNEQGPRPLVAGCYRVRSLNEGVAHFDVLADGSVRERG